MFLHLSPFKTILVTGPQRSGTRICSKMIAHDLKCRHVDEQEFRIDSINGLWRMVAHQDQQAVYHCPAVSRIVHNLADLSPNEIAVVWMLRSTEQIIRSQEDINWRYEPAERIKYDATGDFRPIAEIKLGYWRRFQKPHILNAYEVQYSALKDHPLWVPRAIRHQRRDEGSWSWRETQ